jgi:hypothetical protein
MATKVSRRNWRVNRRLQRKPRSTGNRARTGNETTGAVIAQPWPVGWAYDDVLYVDYIDGEYFLLSPVHPGVQIAINVIL